MGTLHCSPGRKQISLAQYGCILVLLPLFHPAHKALPQALEMVTAG